VETQFGYHIIKFEERRAAQTVSVEEASERIRPYLAQLRLQEVVQELIEELRASADVESALVS
jgi:parvulin-like peptidyl-prolyl isomerase